LGCQNVNIMKIRTPLYLGVFISTILLALSPKLVNAVHFPDLKSHQTTLIARKASFFIENKGQLSESPLEIKYYGHSNDVFFYCKPGMISFVFTKIKNDEKNLVSEATGLPDNDIKRPNTDATNYIYTSRMNLVLTGSNPLSTIIATDQQKYYENFYTTGNADHGITNVHTYKTVTYQNIYPDIDLILKAVGQGMEYSFLVHPGGKISDIQLRWDGAEKTKVLENDGIRYTNAIGGIVESGPKSFANGQEVISHYRKKGNNYGFEVENYNNKVDLLIDPTLTWATYFGGEFEDDGNAVSTDADGNVFITGETYSGLHIATTGAYQTSFSGNGHGLNHSRSSDVFVAKFNSLDTLEWATYYGGPGNANQTNDATGIKADALGNVYIIGSTSSATDIATSGAFQTTFTGTAAFLAKFNNSGGLDWATYFSGNGSSGGSAVTTDVSGNVIITGSVANSTGLATSGAYQTSYQYPGGGCCYLAKFSSSGTEIWATYYGQYGSTQEGSLATDASGNIYLAGSDGGSSGMATNGAYQTSSGGNYDALLSKFSSSGARIWATYFGGNNEDEAVGVVVDKDGNVYMAGQTKSTTGIATSGAQQTSLGGGNDAFLAKFNNSGKLSWATYFGGIGNDEAGGICTDIFGNIMITGSTGSYSGIATSNGSQTSYGGAFLAVYNTTGKLNWASYYGGAGETGNGICADAYGDIYITGSASDSGGVATANAYQIMNNGKGDAYLAKFVYDLFQNDAGIDSMQSPDGVVCAGLQPVNVYLHNAGTEPLSSVNINWTVNGTSQPADNLSNTISPGMSIPFNLGNFKFSQGLYIIKAWTSKPNNQIDSFPFNDTLVDSFVVNPVPMPIEKTDSACYGKFITIGGLPISGHRYKWTSSSGFTSNTSDPNVLVVLDGLYILRETITATGCSTVDSVNVKVNPLPNALWSVSNVSKNYLFKVSDSSLSKASYTWNFGDSSALESGYHVNHVFQQSKKYTIKLLVTNRYGCVSENDSTIDITSAGLYSALDPPIKSLDIYPNPFTDKTLINFDLLQISHVKISVLDMKGNVLFAPSDKTFSAGPNKVEIYAGEMGLSPGTYFLNMMVNDQVISRKLIEMK